MSNSNSNSNSHRILLYTIFALPLLYFGFIMYDTQTPPKPTSLTKQDCTKQSIKDVCKLNGDKLAYSRCIAAMASGCDFEFGEDGQ